MFILRLIALLVIIAVLFWLIKRLFSPAPEPPKLKSAKSENMLQCKYCGVHVPESAVVSQQNESYCCPEHAELDQQ